MCRGMENRKLPMTDSIEELAEFWDTHDATDFWDEFEEVAEPIFEPNVKIIRPTTDAD